MEKAINLTKHIRFPTSTEGLLLT